MYNGGTLGGVASEVQKLRARGQDNATAAHHWYNVLTGATAGDRDDAAQILADMASNPVEVTAQRLYARLSQSQGAAEVSAAAPENGLTVGPALLSGGALPFGLSPLMLAGIVAAAGFALKKRKRR